METATGSATQPPWGAYAPSATANAVLWLARNSILGRGLGRKITAAVFKSLHAGPTDVRLWGTEVRLYPDNNVVERKALLRPDHFDAPERDFLRDTMSDKKPVFVDVGGNAGFYTLDAALHAADDATIVMIEPDSDLIGRLAFNLGQARGLGKIRQSVNIHSFAVAISDHEGQGTLATSGDEGSRNIVASTETRGRVVQLRPLYSVVRDARLDHIDIIKIDVEGHEDKVLPPYFLNAPQYLWPRRIIVEHLQQSLWTIDCIGDAKMRGYTIVKTTRNNTFLEKSRNS